MIARLAVLALAAAGLAVAVHGLIREDACSHAVERARALRAGQAGAGVAADVGAHCDEPRRLVVAAAYLDHAGARAAAVAVARRLTRESPDAYVGWLTLGRLLGSRAALARAHALNPRGVR